MFFGVLTDIRRTLLDIKRRAPETPVLSARYIDMIQAQINADLVQDMDKLRSKVRANRFYAVPWTPEVGGLDPNADKIHAQYIRGFCDDTARILGESVLRWYGGRVVTREWEAVAEEVGRHAMGVLQMTRVFAGREKVLDEICEFIENEDRQVLVVYGMFIFFCLISFLR